jgi:hypothetical protein
MRLLGGDRGASPLFERADADRVSTRVCVGAAAAAAVATKNVSGAPAMTMALSASSDSVHTTYIGTRAALEEENVRLLLRETPGDVCGGGSGGGGGFGENGVGGGGVGGFGGGGFRFPGCAALATCAHAVLCAAPIAETTLPLRSVLPVGYVDETLPLLVSASSADVPVLWFAQP